MIKIILGFKRRQGMEFQEFMDYRSDVHAPLLFAIPEAKKIRRFIVNYSVPAPDFPEPTYDAVVEAWFDTLEDLNALYSCENFLTKVDPDHANFIDLSSVGRVVVKELIVVN
ncbi:EthD family reductase [Brucellaceae bacterium VT-16-1752]|nr:EthD family reductase [Brucellaceae bacterium VT-16-1752]